MRWAEDLRIGIRAIDEQHQWLFECLSRLKKAAASDTSDSAIQIALVELCDYVNLHFFMEEGLMRSLRYPRLGSHVREHETISEELENLRRKAEECDVFDETVTLLNDWLVNHIGSSDRHFASFRQQMLRQSED